MAISAETVMLERFKVSGVAKRTSVSEITTIDYETYEKYIGFDLLS